MTLLHNMSELKRKRYKIVKSKFDEYAFERNGVKCMSFYDMAWIINNHWEVEHFVTNEDEIEKKYKHSDSSYAIPSYQIQKIYNSINHAIRGTDIKSERNGYMGSYLFQDKE